MPKLLLVDDDPGVLSMFGDYFSGRGSTVFCAGTARKGLELSLRERPEVVILDLGLPDSRGEEVLRKLKASLPGNHVIVVTGQGGENLKERVLRLGAEDYFRKGEVTLSEIERRIKELVRKSLFILLLSPTS